MGANNPRIGNDADWSILTQLLFIALLLPITWWLWSKKEALSVTAGWLICLLPNLYLYWRVFAIKGARQAQGMVKAFYRGEAVKWMLTVLLFALFLSLKWVAPAGLFIGYILTQIVFFVPPILISYLNLKR